MLIKIEATTKYAGFEQVFDDAELAFDKHTELEEQGWEVHWTEIPMDKETYYKKLSDELTEAVEFIISQAFVSRIL